MENGACKLILVDVENTAEGVEVLFFPWELLTVDLESNYPINVRRCRDYENRTHILLRGLMLTMLREGRRPESILVSDPSIKKEPCNSKVPCGIRQRPTLPGRLQPSTIGAERLNFCVRYGNRWIPFAIATGML